MTTRKQRLTAAQVQKLIDLAERQLALLEKRAKQQGITLTEPDPHTPLPTIEVGTTIDLYGNGDTYVFTSVEANRSTLERIDTGKRQPYSLNPEGLKTQHQPAT